MNTNLRIKLSKKITKNQKKIFIKCLDNIVRSTNTFDLLTYFKKNRKNLKLYFLMGADNLINLHKWYKWERIPNVAKIIVFARSDYATKALNSVAAKKLKKDEWMYIKSKKIDISSSLIRKF